MRLRWTRSALRDLESIGDHVGTESARAASALVSDILRRVEALRDQPRMGRTGRVEGTREFVVTGTSYLVAYRLTHTSIDVLAVLHCARRWPDHFD